MADKPKEDAKPKAVKKNKDGFEPGQVLSFEQITAAQKAAAKKPAKE